MLIASEYFKFQSRIPFADKKFALKSLYGVMQSPNNLPCTKQRQRRGSRFRHLLCRRARENTFIANMKLPRYHFAYIKKLLYRRIAQVWRGAVVCRTSRYVYLSRSSANIHPHIPAAFISHIFLCMVLTIFDFLTLDTEKLRCLF